MFGEVSRGLDLLFAIRSEPEPRINSESRGLKGSGPGMPYYTFLRLRRI